MAKQLPVADWKERVLFFVGRRQAFRVEGDSMSPTLSDGDAVLIKTTRKEIAIGDIILARHPFKQNAKLIKRIRDLDFRNGAFLIGDNEDESTDSRSFGRIPYRDILGTVTCRLK
jgi:nickel-type superoxide dismutase maturation protease